MKLFAASFLLFAISVSGGVVAQQGVREAREEGTRVGKAMRADGALVPGQAQVDAVPGYQGTDLPESGYFDDPDRLTTDGMVRSQTDDAFGTVIDRQGTRRTFTKAEVLDATRRATMIEKTPEQFLEGEGFGGSAGSCTPLPPPAGDKGYYEATCNKGVKVEERPRSCTIRMVPRVTNNARYFYWGSTNVSGLAPDTYLRAQIAAGVCRAEPVTMHACDAQIEMGAGGQKVEDYRRFCKSKIRVNASLYSCSAELPTGPLDGHQNSKTGTVWYKQEGTTSVNVERVESGCDALVGDTTCAAATDTCVEPSETRIVNGVSVTQACWAWRRETMCHAETPASDCSEIEGNRACRFLRDECLDDPQTGACKVSQKAYSCPLPDTQNAADKQYVCGGDVYCLNGECESIEREASSEFKDALTGLHALDEAGGQFDPAKLTVFSGERGACSKKIFGASNCCSGKGVPILTPWLCSAADRSLDERDDKGLCHKVGTYCSDKVLGVCITSRTAYCCFGSKLARILQEQGRAQLAKPWGRAKDATCQGFSIEEFQRLDLSKMDFAEVYAEFTDAAKLPDEVRTMTEIQRRIEDYYARG
ncbi:conjugal transfer protein TraN [Sphingomonas sp. Leaf4]|uniref:conjugal transfer protein TraN n=1 Tax=Sphingomonas sp. Leaf4 TaxID=2876553 RepID=UPI001E5DC0FA|nr:conjugal transfer protein TraN [Sphingomonas sp. Leaf4]